MTFLWSLQLATWLTANAGALPQPTVRVATIAYPGGTPGLLGCKTDRCAFEQLIRLASAEGAKIVVTAEYAMPQRNAEPRLLLGKRPLQSLAPLHTWLAGLAAELDLYLGVDLETEDTRGRAFNSFVVFDPEGSIAARHDKIELFEGERQTMTPGAGVTTLDSPYGRLGLLICADLYAEPVLHHELLEGHRPHIVLVSAAWTVPVATRWQAAFAHDWKVHVVAANASLGSGRGGGVFNADGRSVGRTGPTQDIVFADIPVAPIRGSVGSNLQR